MAPVRVAEFELCCDLETFLREFWRESEWYERFLRETLGDRDITIGEWSTSSDAELVRDVKSYHPSKISFPGMPSFAESCKTQTLEVTVNNEDEHCALLRETNNIKGIPYADYFCVNIKWEVTHKKKYSPWTGTEYETDRILQSPQSLRSPGLSVDETDLRGGGPRSQVTVWLDFEFFKYTWLQGTIESNTQAELVGLFEQWQEAAHEHLSLQQRGQRLQECNEDDGNALHLALVVGEVPVKGADEDGNSGGGGASERTPSPRDEQGNGLGLGLWREGRASIRTQPTGPLAGGVGVGGLGNGDEEIDIEEFYDCVDGGELGSGGGMATSLSWVSSDGSLASGSGLAPRGSILGGRERGNASLPRVSSFSRDRAVTGASLTPVMRGGVDSGAPLTSRDVAVTLVETIFVVAEASFWHVHNIYRSDTKQLFTVQPMEVLRRVVNSLCPGRHGSVLAAPDLYGPLLGVLLLPQVLLISIDVTRHGCNQTLMLGNATMATLSLWAGLSVLYRLLALVIAPGLRFKHCMSISGYSFYAWSLALLCSYPLERHKAVVGFVPVATPLVLFGVPAALAQGWLFWEHTPYASLTVQQALFPSSVQHFAQRHSRLLQSVLWAVPKVAALIVVAGTHYQLLWYLARVFLPGRKHLCNLSSLGLLADRAQLSDVVSQKELRMYALLLLKGGRDD